MSMNDLSQAPYPVLTGRGAFPVYGLANFRDTGSRITRADML